MRWWVTPLQSVVTLFLFVEAAALLGLAAFPAAEFFFWCQGALAPSGLRTLWLCMAGAFSYFIFGLGLMVVLPVTRWVTFSLGTPVGRYPYISFKGYQWASYNALILMVRFTFLNWVRATPFNVMFYRLMGMKAGARVQINTAVVADCNLISIGSDTVVGGDVTLIAHSVEGPDLITERVSIGSRVTIGLMAVIMPGCEIGDDAVIAANAVLKKGSKIGRGEIWGGVPAKKIGVRSGI